MCVLFFKKKKNKTKKARAVRMIRPLVKGFLVLLTFSVCSALLWYVWLPREVIIKQWWLFCQVLLF